MENTDKYFGWKNWDTWNFVLWVSNDYYAAKSIEKITAKLRDFHCEKWTGENAEKAVYSFFGDSTPDGAKAENVDWDEVADTFNEW